MYPVFDRLLMTVPVAAKLADGDVLPAPDAGASRANPVAARPRSAARDALPWYHYYVIDDLVDVARRQGA